MNFDEKKQNAHMDIIDQEEYGNIKRRCNY